ncbi:MAG: hypothetical protein ACRCV6_04465 [Formosimonas sp.]
MALNLKTTVSTPALSRRDVWGLALIMALGGAAAAWVLPTIAPLLAQSLTSEQAKGYWFISRASGVAAYVLFWLAMMLGLLMSNKLLRQYIKPPTLLALHEFASLLGWGFATVHAFILLGDEYIHLSVWQVLIPWTNDLPQVHFISFGQLAWYLLGLIVLSFHLRSRIGMTAWRWLHVGAFLAYMLVTVHGLLAGTDTSSLGMMTLYVVSNGAIVFLTLYRMFSLRFCG